LLKFQGKISAFQIWKFHYSVLITLRICHLFSPFKIPFYLVRPLFSFRAFVFLYLGTMRHFSWNGIVCHIEGNWPNRETAWTGYQIEILQKYLGCNIFNFVLFLKTRLRAAFNEHNPYTTQQRRTTGKCTVGHQTKTKQSTLFWALKCVDWALFIIQ
jgi:hypothetical protein